MRKLGIGVAGLVVIIGAALWLVASSAVLDPWRQATLSKILSEGIGRPVAINGHVRLQPGLWIGVSAAGLSIPNPQWTDEPSLLSVGEASFKVPACLIWGCPFDIAQINLSNITAAFEISADGEASWQSSEPDQQAGGALPFPVEVVSALQEAENLALIISDKQTGWHFDGRIADWKATSSDQGERWTLRSNGTINGVPFEFSGNTGAQSTSGYAGDLTFTSDGIAAALSLTSDVWDFETNLDGNLTLEIDRASTFLDLLDLAYQGRASGTLTMDLGGDFATLGSPRFDLRVNTIENAEVHASGTIGNIWQFADSEIDFSWTPAPPPDAPEVATDIYDVVIQSIAGRAAGSLSEFSVSDVVLSTNAKNLDIPTIGPVDIGTFHREDDGRLMLPHYDITLGPLDDPILIVEGAVSDVFGGELTARGEMDIYAGLFVDLPDGADASALGRAEGSFALEVLADGPHLRQLDVAITNTDLVSGTIVLVDGGAADEDDRVHVALEIPDVAPYLAALGAAPVDLGALAVDIDLTREGNALNGAADLRVNDTTILSNVRLAEVAGRANLSGVMSIPRLDLHDVTALALANAQSAPAGRRDKEPAPGTTNILGFNIVDVDLDILSDEIVGAEDTVSNLRAKLILNRGELSIDPIELAYLGGSFSGNMALDLMDDALPASFRGIIDALDLSVLVPEAIAGLPVIGDLTAVYNLDVSLANTRAAATSLTGTVTAGLRDGEIGTNKLEVAGIGVVGFLFSKAARQEHSDLKCAVATLEVENGVGTISNAVFETEFSHASINGKVDFVGDTVDILVESRPIDKPEAWSYIPAEISGPLSAPEFRLIPGEYRHKSEDRTPITDDDVEKAAERVDACHAAAAFLAR